MEDDCVILGTFEKNNKVDDTINVFDVEADAQEESKKISNPFTKKKLKRNSSVRGECKNKKKKKKKEMGRAVNELPTTSNINISRSYITAESHYSISETEIHHLVGGVSMVNRGTNTDPERNVTSDDPIMCCCVKGHKSLPGIQVNNDSQSINRHKKYSSAILDLSNGLVLNELQNMGHTKIVKNLKPNVPDGYIDLKGKGN